MAVQPLVAKYENRALTVTRGDRGVVFQPFRPSIGDDEQREWIDEEDAMTYWNSIKRNYYMAGCTSEEVQELALIPQEEVVVEPPTYLVGNGDIVTSVIITG